MGKILDEHYCEGKTHPLRLNRAISSSGICSRRKADTLIFEGRIRVNGICQTSPALRVSCDDKIEVDGEVIKILPDKLYIMMNKPIHTICTLNDPQKRKTVMDILPPEMKNKGLFPVGRLDYFSEGLLLIVNDGDFAQNILHPSHCQGKMYEVLIREKISANALQSMRAGMFLEDGTHTMPIKVHAKKHSSGGTLLHMELHQGLNRQIRRMCAMLNLTILFLKRTAIGNLHIGKLKPGKIRHLTSREVADLLAESCLS